MADNKILMMLQYDDSGVVTGLKATKQGFQDIDLTVKNAENSQKKLNQAISQMKGTAKSVKITEAEYKKLVKTQSQLSNASGAATSSVMELGRVVQDSAYGMRGMANNITQFATQMAYATKESGGLGGALKDMGKAFLGPMGVIFAISVAVSIMERMEQAAGKANKALLKIAESGVSEAVTELTLLKEALDDTSISLEKKESLIKNAREEYDELNDALGDTPINIANTLTALDLLIAKYQDVAKAKVLVELITEQLKSQAKSAATVTGSWTDMFGSMDKFMFGLSSLWQGQDVAKGVSLGVQSELTKSEEFIKKYEGMLNQKTKHNPNLTYLELIYGKEGKSRKGKDRPKVKALTDLDMVEGMALDYTPKINFKLSDETLAAGDAFNRDVVRMMADKFATEEYAEYADKAQEALGAISSFIDAQFDRQLTTEENHTNALNEELNNRLLNEKLSAEERKKIQNQIAVNDEALRVKQNEIKKKAFNTNKAFQLSMAVADTAGSVLKAYGSQLVIGDPTSIVRAKVAASIAGAMGALQIATIASSKFQPDAASTPIRTAGVGGSGGGGSRNFDFNLVGSSQNNQIADAISGQFNQPLKAYVVSKDITNQQQLDANTKSSARFGG